MLARPRRARRRLRAEARTGRRAASTGSNNSSGRGLRGSPPSAAATALGLLDGGGAPSSLRWRSNSVQAAQSSAVRRRLWTGLGVYRVAAKAAVPGTTSTTSPDLHWGSSPPVRAAQTRAVSASASTALAPETSRTYALDETPLRPCLALASARRPRQTALTPRRRSPISLVAQLSPRPCRPPKQQLRQKVAARCRPPRRARVAPQRRHALADLAEALVLLGLRVEAGFDVLRYVQCEHFHPAAPTARRRGRRARRRPAAGDRVRRPPAGSIRCRSPCGDAGGPRSPFQPAATICRVHLPAGRAAGTACAPAAAAGAGREAVRPWPRHGGDAVLPRRVHRSSSLRAGVDPDG